MSASAKQATFPRGANHVTFPRLVFVYKRRLRPSRGPRVVWRAARAACPILPGRTFLCAGCLMAGWVTNVLSGVKGAGSPASIAGWTRAGWCSCWSPAAGWIGTATIFWSGTPHGRYHEPGWCCIATHNSKGETKGRAQGNGGGTQRPVDREGSMLATG